jgi:hypothetical protein
MSGRRDKVFRVSVIFPDTDLHGNIRAKSEEEAIEKFREHYEEHLLNYHIKYKVEETEEDELAGK